MRLLGRSVRFELFIVAIACGAASACAPDAASATREREEDGVTNEDPQDDDDDQQPDVSDADGRPDGGRIGPESIAPPPMVKRPTRGTGTPGAGSADENACATFESSYEAIQKVIFERRGCTAAACHGAAKVGALDLRADVSWESLVDAESANSSYARVQPGTASESFLFQKLQAATEPGSVDIPGSPMPVGTDALTEKELAAIQLWILKGAPKTGVVRDETKNLDVGSLLDACLPPAKPVKTKPLEPPAPEEGIQLVLPPYLLKASSEIEQCTPFAFDLSDKVPAKYKDPARNVMFINGSRVRQDPQSHHLVLWNPNKDLDSVAASEAGWTCRGGPNDGRACSASMGSKDCGEDGVCAGESVAGTLCNIDTESLASGGPITLDTIAELIGIISGGGLPSQVANTQSPQQYTPPFEGVYQELPLRGVLWFNSHAFNLTEEDTVLEARVNYYYATERIREMRPTNVIDNNHVADGQPPFTRKTYCGKTVVPRGYSIAMMTGHTHRRGEHFWVTDSTGAKIYESFDYNDPEYKRYAPWIDFHQPDEQSRTLEYCATYNNGLKQDGSPDLDLVTRKSRMPERTTCTPIACTAGKVTAACTTDRDCDSAPDMNDGQCDACPIKGGQTTENEMFVMMPWYVLPPTQ